MRPSVDNILDPMTDPDPMKTVGWALVGRLLIDWMLMDWTHMKGKMVSHRTSIIFVAVGWMLWIEPTGGI